MGESFETWALKEQYAKVRGLGDRLELMKTQIRWEPFRPLIARVFHDDTKTGGRPHTDEILVVRCMLLQAWYGLSDPELEYQCNDRLSFRNFLGHPETVPDFSTIWRIRELLQDQGIDDLIWTELQRQLDAKGYTVKKGVIQDASFLHADPGKKRRQEEKKSREQGNPVEYSEKQLQHIDQDATYAKKNAEIAFGYKRHYKSCVDHSLIRELDVTSANVHDNKIDLVTSNDKVAYRDKGYFGARLRARRVHDMTMKRATRARKLNGGEQRRNTLIKRIRGPGERPFAIVKRVFHGDRTCVKTLARVRTLEVFKAFAYDLYQLVALERKRLAQAL